MKFDLKMSKQIAPPLQKKIPWPKNMFFSQFEFRQNMKKINFQKNPPTKIFFQTVIFLVSTPFGKRDIIPAVRLSG